MCFSEASSTPDTVKEQHALEERVRSSEGVMGDGRIGGLATVDAGDGSDSEASSEEVAAGSSVTFVKAILHLPDEDSRPSVSG